MATARTIDDCSAFSSFTCTCLVVGFVLSISSCGSRQSAAIATLRKMTDISLSSENVTLIAYVDDHGGYFGDGELTLALSVGSSDLTRISKAAPPWNVPQWNQGPLPTQVASKLLHISNEAPELLKSKTVLYVVDDRGPTGFPLHNGDLLILDTANSRIWLISWDA